MTDEELFNAWKSEQYKDQSTEEKMEFVEHLHIFPKYFEKTFLAGLKAGRPQWHDLRENPTDLPEEPTEKMKVNETWAYVKFFDNTYGLVDKGALKNYKGAISWCEIPTFDKE